jgi:tRNA (Thr-GGU) A37 N-methylase
VAASARRDLVLQSPKNDKSTRGTFSLRSPVRPNPSAPRRQLVGIEGNVVWCAVSIASTDAAPGSQARPPQFTPLAPPQAGDFETE